MRYLDLTEAELRSKGASFTAMEIAQQPDLWRKIYRLICSQQEKLAAFLGMAYREVDHIILTGAGTSAFIGISLQGIFFKNCDIITSQVPTTDLLSHPFDYLDSNHSVLMISFARSGESPESCAALKLADRISKKCIHVIVTCNAEGGLAAYKTTSPKYVLVLPPESNDKSLAMTSSYTGMLLTGILMAKIGFLKEIEEQVQFLCQYGEKVLSHDVTLIRSIAEKDFSRIVFLGSGPLAGTATESQLKLQELTDGKVICKHDTYLGFRHGPKAVIDHQTLIVYFFSNDAYVSRYEKDMVHSMREGKKALFELGIGEYSDFMSVLNASIVLSDAEQRIEEDFLSVCCILPIQILGLFTSLKFGLEPDAPSASGAITRIVNGVVIYPFNDEKIAVD